MAKAPDHPPYNRKRFLALVEPADRVLAARLCDLLEAVYPPDQIRLYRGTAMPVVIRDMEWLAGFAMRRSHPVAYCCSPPVLEAMGPELAPYLSGKSCVAVKPRRGESIDVVLSLVGRAFAEASRHGGMISKADKRRRDRLRRESAPAAASSPTAGRGAGARKKAAKKASTRQAVKPTGKKSSIKSSIKSSTKSATRSAKKVAEGAARKPR